MIGSEQTPEYLSAEPGRPGDPGRRRHRRPLAAPDVPLPVILHLGGELEVPEHVLDRRPLRCLLGQAPQAGLHDRLQ